MASPGRVPTRRRADSPGITLRPDLGAAQVRSHAEPPAALGGWLACLASLGEDAYAITVSTNAPDGSLLALSWAPSCLPGTEG